MYKIKNDIDLKELEKFHYVESTFWDVKCYAQYNLQYQVFVNLENRKIIVQYTQFGTHPSDDRVKYVMEDIEEFIDDLIQANLVEKVSEND